MTARSRAALLVLALALSPLLVASSCGGGSQGTATRLRDGSFRLTCEKPLAICLSQAEAICKGKAYSVLSGQDERKLYGPEFGTSQLEIRRSQAHIRCGAQSSALIYSDEEGERPAQDGDGAFRLVRPSASVAPLPPPRAAAPARACVPGTTQACVGAAACPGGQSCLADGSGFGTCDCGAAVGAAGAGGAAGSGGGAVLSGKAGAGGRGAGVGK